MKNIKCKYCGKEDYVVNSKKFPSEYCSYSCYERWRRWNEKPNCECCVCGKKMYMKPHRLRRVKNGITCSKECDNILKSKYLKGSGNHQYELIGDKNSSFKQGIIYTSAGYALEYCPGHPYPHDKYVKGSRVLQHRLVVERNSELFSNDYFETINDQKVLKPMYDVHHINEIVTDNRIENLMILSRSEHTILHNRERNKLKKSIGVFKSGNIGESCDANPEITDDSNISSES